VLGSGASKGQQSIDDRGLAPPPVIYGEPLPYSGPIAGQTLRQGTPMASGRAALREPCRPKAVGGLELVCLAQGRVILAGSTFRREKMRLGPCTDRRPDAARASSRRLAGRHGRHWFLRRRELIVQLAIAHRSDQNIDDEGDLIVALSLALTPQELQALDAAHPPPSR
jgi:hypothetical protein